ncbi:MAG: flagellar basal-body rod protein FlgB [Candidatus Latescibacteria bacterium 4484_7]|nr:MAG: flagellar basal-body rod protein FlgB [Candidatus Latescibacteria bacterium 4484_7]RKZ06443.1 MAG: flagellar basal body rod protein FlgB [bacterium]
MIVRFVLPRTGVARFKQALDAYSLRQRVVAQNIANVQTPGYRRKEVSFEDSLKRAFVQRLQLAPVENPPRSIPIGMPTRQVPRVVEVKDDYSNGVNNVDMEKEMTKMVETNLAYSMMTKFLKGRFENLHEAITGRIK